MLLTCRSINYLIKIFCLILTISCSNNEYQNFHTLNFDNLHKNKLHYSSLLTFNSSNNIHRATDYVNRLKIYLSADDNLIKNKIWINFINNQFLSDDIAYEIIPILNKRGYGLEIHYSKNTIHDADAFEEIFYFIKNLTSERYATGKSFFEIYYNAKADNTDALITLAKIRKDSFIESSSTHYIQNLDFLKRNASRASYWNNIITELNSQKTIERYKSKQTSLQESLILKNLDHAPFKDQLNILIAENNRLAITTLLENYIPWDYLTPSEISFWNNYIYFLKHASINKDKVLLFISLEDNQIKEGHLNKISSDLINNQFISAGIFANKQILKNNDLHVFKNINSFKIGIDDNHQTHEYSQSARIINYFQNHKKYISESLFIEGSLDLNNIVNEKTKKIAAVLVDSNLTYLNFMAQDSTLLIPLFIFPDEIINIVDLSDIAISSKQSHQTYLNELKSILLKNHEKLKKEEIHKLEQKSLEKSKIRNGFFGDNIDYIFQKKLVIELGPIDFVPKLIQKECQKIFLEIIK